MSRTGRRIAAALVGALAVATMSRADEVAWVARINGAPAVVRAEQRLALRRGDIVMVGDVIETNETAKVKVLLGDDSVLDVGPNSRVALQGFLLDSTRRQVRLAMLLGRFKLAVSKFLTGATDYSIRTPTAVAGVRGTVLWGDTERDAICALDGSIEVIALSGGGEPARLSAGECVNQMKAGKTASLRPSAAELATYLKEVTLD